MTQASGPAPIGHDDQAAAGTAAARQCARRIPPTTVTAMLAAAARAPSIHNTQPWRFVVSTHAIDLYADPARKLRYDRAGREMLISALPHRHTHRGAFDPGEVPAGLLAGLQHDALAEGATLALTDSPGKYAKLAALAAEATRMQAMHPEAREEIIRWSRAPGSPAKDGVPAAAFAPASAAPPGRLAQRDFDVGRHFGLLPAPDQTGHRPPRPRCWSRWGTGEPTGCALARRCTVSSSTRRQSGYPPACTPSPWSSRRSGTSSGPGWHCRGHRRCCCSSGRRTAACPRPAGRCRTF